MLKLGARDDFALAHPTPDHFIPLLYVAGLAAEEGSHADVLIDGFTMGSISMIAYTVGCDPVQVSGTGGGAPGMPDVSPEDANI